MECTRHLVKGGGKPSHRTGSSFLNAATEVTSDFGMLL